MLKASFAIAYFNKVKLYTPETALLPCVYYRIIGRKFNLLEFPETAEVAIVVLFLARYQCREAKYEEYCLSHVAKF